MPQHYQQTNYNNRSSSATSQRATSTAFNTTANYHQNQPIPQSSNRIIITKEKARAMHEHDLMMKAFIILIRHALSQMQKRKQMLTSGSNKCDTNNSNIFIDVHPISQQNTQQYHSQTRNNSNYSSSPNTTEHRGRPYMPKSVVTGGHSPNAAGNLFYRSNNIGGGQYISSTATVSPSYSPYAHQAQQRPTNKSIENTKKKLQFSSVTGSPKTNKSSTSTQIVVPNSKQLRQPPQQGEYTRIQYAQQQLQQSQYSSMIAPSPLDRSSKDENPFGEIIDLKARRGTAGAIDMNASLKNQATSRNLIDSMFSNLDAIEGNIQDLSTIPHSTLAQMNHMHNHTADKYFSDLDRLEEQQILQLQSQSQQQRSFTDTKNQRFDEGYSFNQFQVSQNNNTTSDYQMTDSCSGANLPTKENHNNQNNESITDEKRIEVLSRYFVKMHLYTVANRDRRQERNRLRQLDEEAQKFYERLLKEKTISLLKAFAIVSTEAQEKLWTIQSKVKKNLLIKYWHILETRFRGERFEQERARQKLELKHQNLMSRAFMGLRENQIRIQQKRALDQQMVIPSMTAIEVLIETYLKTKPTQKMTPAFAALVAEYEKCLENYSIFTPRLIELFVISGLMTKSSSKCLQLQSDRVVQNTKRKCFDALQMMHRRSAMATQLYSIQILRKAFTSLKSFQQERSALKAGIESLISRKLFFQLQGILAEWKQQTLIKKNLNNRSMIIFAKYAEKTFKSCLSTWVAKFNLQVKLFNISQWKLKFKFILLFKRFILQKQIEKSRQMKARNQFMKVIGSKVMVSLKQNRILQKQKKGVNSIAKKLLATKLLQKSMFGFSQNQQIRTSERQKELEIERKHSIGVLKTHMVQWRLQLFYNRMIAEHRKAVAFSWLKQGYYAEKKDSEYYEGLLQEFQAEKAKKLLRNALLSFSTAAQLRAEQYKAAFELRYNFLQKKGFTALKDKIQRSYQRYSNVYVYLRKKRRNRIVNAFSNWHHVTVSHAIDRNNRKRALGFYIQKLFRTVMNSLIVNVIRSKNIRQKKEWGVLFQKNAIWQRWRQVFVSRLVEKKDAQRLMISSLKGLQMNRIHSLKKKEEYQRAHYFMCMSLYKKAQAFIEVLKINKEKQLLKRIALHNAQSQLINKKKRFILAVISNYVKRKQDIRQRLHIVRNLRDKEALRAYFEAFVEHIVLKKQAAAKVAIRLMSRVQETRSIALSIWREAMLIDIRDCELENKEQFLWETRQKRILFQKLREYTIEKRELDDKYEKADYFLKRQVFIRFTNMFYKSFEIKKLKMISTRHFANSLLKRAILGWKTHSRALVEERYQKVDDYVDNPFLMSQKKNPGGALPYYLMTENESEKENINIPRYHRQLFTQPF